MAAIKPHLEQQDDPSETEAEREVSSRTYDEMVETDGMSGLGDEFPLTEEAALALQTSHSELVRLAYTRKAVAEELKNNSYKIKIQGHRDGTAEIILELTTAITGAVWNAAGAGNMRNFKLLSWTQKMGTPSFSLPAGATEIGGTCPGAKGGQSLVPLKALLSGQKLVERVTGKPVILADATCERCYATGGNYAYGSMVVSQSLREMWARAALADGTFVDTMSWAVDNADYKLNGGSIKTEKDKDGKTKTINYEPERFPGRYFRIHDSGDFFSPDYLKAWKEVANNFKSGPNKIMFWAPTRIWATDWGIRVVNAINSDEDSNLIIRPSTYHINEAAPDPQRLAEKDGSNGWSSWSVCWAASVKKRLLQHSHRGSPGGAGMMEASDIAVPFDWDCQAYAVDDEAHSCRNARGPKKTDEGSHGDTGCRACWVNTKNSVNYTEH
jgi:hypothetical protein